MFWGVDGCRQGWFCVIAHSSTRFSWQIQAELNLATLRQLGVVRLAIDIPIGLPNGLESRACDRVARQYLPGATSRVFPVPVRGVIEQWPLNYSAANQLSRQYAGKGISHQTFNITDKIAQIDHQHLQTPGASEWVYETHPEVLFAALNNGHPLPSKKTQQGQQIRWSLLGNQALQKLYQEAVKATQRSQVQRDDILDACVCALAALAGDLISIGPPETDSRDLPMRICVPYCWR
ncbi:DUF429 domain-containing protein [Leptolyngbya sp. FACHB-261]|uniref:DUF429 domain-containing protein n=1 Tax=Leptolyngbya sp. FACHB-261 TaxID=2692806 RepID=UPI0016863539|nr:DUF429 domain-containing protein [Leptolyngbya sp. FACHB-261]MBD2101089.1 DUF429 domain-containing protein [Leptolyngbya sp. FACHB-261]